MVAAQGGEASSRPLDLPLEQGLHQLHAAAEPVPADRSALPGGSIGLRVCGERPGLTQPVVAIHAANESARARSRPR